MISITCVTGTFAAGEPAAAREPAAAGDAVEAAAVEATAAVAASRDSTPAAGSLECFTRSILPASGAGIWD